eukprot:gene14073-16182_t
MGNINNRLIEAATQGDDEQIVKLLEGGRVNLHYKDWDGDTALHWASIGGHLESVNVLLQYGADIHAVDSGGMTPLQGAANFGHINVVQRLLEAVNGLSPQFLLKTDGTTPIVKALLNWHNDVVKLLLSHNPDLNLKDDSGWTALHNAAMSGNGEAVQLLIEHGADVDIPDEGGATAYTWAVNRGFEEVAKLLQPASTFVDQEAVAETMLR